jgi:hypothetical protein
MVIASLVTLMLPGFCVVLWSLFAIDEPGERLMNMALGASMSMLVGLFFAIVAAI